MSFLDRLPTPESMGRWAKQKGAEPSRRQVNDEKVKDEAKDEKRWHKETR